MKSTAASASYLTVSVSNRKEPSPGNFDPSFATLVAGNIASSMKYAKLGDRAKLNSQIHDFSLRAMNMYSGGSTNTYWTNVAQSASEMTYECDANLGTPAAVDCAQVEWSELRPDEETISLVAGRVKFLSSSA